MGYFYVILFAVIVAAASLVNDKIIEKKGGDTEYIKEMTKEDWIIE